MHFHFCTFNHCAIGKRSVEDLVLIMSHQLNALGHTSSSSADVLEHSNYRGNCVNVLIESFADDPKTLERIAYAHECGYRFLYIATEEPTPNGFNNTGDRGMIARQAIYPQAAMYALGTLHLVPGANVTKWYAQHGPSAYAELGYVRSLVRHINVVPEFDYGFFGQMSERRERILEQFKPSLLVCPGIILHQQERDAEMQRCKVLLQIRRFDQMGLISSSRCNTALSIGRPVIAEPHAISSDWEQVIHFSGSLEQFFLDARVILESWQHVYAMQLARFEQKFTPEVCLGIPLRQLGVC